MITSEDFLKATGIEPQQDDLERSNCSSNGQMGHFDCGWCLSKNLPNFMVQPAERDCPVL